jgi:hypothetical protein
MIDTVENNVWKFPQLFEKDESVEKYDFQTIYESTQGTGDLSTSTKFVYSTNDEDKWYIPSQSYLQVEGKLQPAAGGDFAADSLVAITNNGYNIFDEARYYIEGAELEQLNYVGIATLVDGIRSYDPAATAVLEDEWFIPDTHDGSATVPGITANALTLGNEGFAKRNQIRKTQDGKVFMLLPLNKMFTFCKNIQHVFRGVKHRIMLTLNDSSKIVFRGAAPSTDGKFTISKMRWVIPYVEPSLILSERLERQLAKNSSFQLHWEAISVHHEVFPKHTTLRFTLASTVHRPTNLFIGLQRSDRSTSQTLNSMQFDHFNVESVSVRINGNRFPEEPQRCDFSAHDYSEVYNRFVSGCKNNVTFVGKDLYKAVYPIYHVDVSNHPRKIYDASTFPTIAIEITFRTVPTHNPEVFVVIYNEREATLAIDQKKMRVIQ